MPIPRLTYCPSSSSRATRAASSSRVSAIVDSSRGVPSSGTLAAGPRSRYGRAMTDTATTEAGTPYAGVPLKHQDVRFAVSPAEAVAAARAQRGRLLETVRDLTAEEWTAPSRCSAWTVQDVVRHLSHIGGVQADSIEVARTGERFTYFSTF